MIKIKFNLNENEYLNIEPGVFYNITIENREYFRKVVESLCFDFITDCGISIFKGTDNYDLEDIAVAVPNILDLNINTKKNINALNKILKKTYYEDLKSDLLSLKEKATIIVKKIALDLDISLSMNEEIKTDDLFKIMDIKFSDDKETFLERFINFLFVNSELQEKNLFFCLHLKEYFSPEEVEIIVKEVSYKQISVINIETHEYLDSIECQKKILIDKDCCFLI